MSITKTLLAGVAGTVLVGSGAMASEPLKLTDSQMDNVSAGVLSQATAPFVILNSFFGTASGTTGVVSFADTKITVSPCAPAVSIIESGNASSVLNALFNGGGGIATLGGSLALVTNAFNGS